MPSLRWKISVSGIVQGVGFRPFVYRLALGSGLTGFVANTPAGVVIEAQHLCMMMRGVEKQNSVMKTSCMLGAFRREISTRSEFLSLIK